MDLIINLNKPANITSRESTSKIKKLLRAKKAGHTGTLDPAATGILLICTDRATRLASYFSSLDKEYKAVMKLGEVTDTQDAQGNVIKKNDDFEVDALAIKNTFNSFKGAILQKPPMFSALKHKGKPLYKYAHKGIDIPREPREVHIHHIEVLSINLPFINFLAVCSKGTYIRTLCNDIGEKLGTGAHLFELKRTGIGPFKIEDSQSFEELGGNAKNLVEKEALLSKGACPVGKEALLPNGMYTMDNALSWMPELTVKESEVKNIKNGSPVKIRDYPDFVDNPASNSAILMNTSGIKIKSTDNELLAIGSFSPGKNTIKMDVVFG